MCDKTKGWVSVYRSIKDHWIWKEKPFDKRSAWLDILLSANHKDNKVLIGNQLITVEAGSFITSEVKLMEQWGWSKSKVRNFLELLEQDNMIIKKADRKKTTITVVNWRAFQLLETTERPQKDYEQTMSRPQKDHEQTTERPQKDTNNNVNNENNENNVNNENKKKRTPKPKTIQYADAVKMTEEEHTKLIERFGVAETERWIEKLNNYKLSTGKKYKSDYRTILMWNDREDNRSVYKPYHQQNIVEKAKQMIGDTPIKMPTAEEEAEAIRKFHATGGYA